MKYLKFILSKKWIGFTLIFTIVNLGSIWSIIYDGSGSGILIISMSILDGLFVIFSWNEYKLKYPDA